VTWFSTRRIARQALLKYETAMKALEILAILHRPRRRRFRLRSKKAWRLFTSRTDAYPECWPPISTGYRVRIIHPLNPTSHDRRLVAGAGQGGPKVGIGGIHRATVIKQIQAQDPKVQFTATTTGGRGRDQWCNGADKVDLKSAVSGTVLAATAIGRSSRCVRRQFVPERRGHTAESGYELLEHVIVRAAIAAMDRRGRRLRTAMRQAVRSLLQLSVERV